MTPDNDAEIARLRRELEYAIDAARENGSERDELARQLGAEVATTQRLRAALTVARNAINSLDEDAWRCFDVEKVIEMCDAVLASGNGDGDGK